MASLLEELIRRQAESRQRIEELGEQLADARHRGRFRTRLASGKKPYRKRMATLAVVYDAVPAPRRPHDVVSLSERSGDRSLRNGPAAIDKWIYGSVIDSAEQVIAVMFDQAEARDSVHARTRIVLADGDHHQIQC
ncbi:hypothetical protein AB0L65_62795 [Nonomuraea sp. NPDC052116]|uniref:hypothetical protein n=1 Tax=Nonomuraea sp. NPDC052116 TaxID=3155665 RepID=UPI00343DC18F